MKFNSQICTTREQSDRLIALGLKRETADMCRYKDSDGYWTTGLVEETEQDVIEYYDIPAWSLHRLIEMLGCVIQTDGKYIYLPEFGFDKGQGLYDNIIDCIEWLIKEGYFNKDYLV